MGEPREGKLFSFALKEKVIAGTERMRFFGLPYKSSEELGSIKAVSPSSVGFADSFSLSEEHAN